MALICGNTGENGWTPRPSGDSGDPEKRSPGPRSWPLTWENSGQWSYGDSNPRPLACHQRADRPPQSIAAGHHPGTCAPIRSCVSTLLYFPAVPRARHFPGCCLRIPAAARHISAPVSLGRPRTAAREMWHGLRNAAQRHDPPGGLAGDSGDAIIVAVIVHQRDALALGDTQRSASQGGRLPEPGRNSTARPEHLRGLGETIGETHEC
jgi:hypothetical protein